MARAVIGTLRRGSLRDPAPILRRLALRAGHRLLGREATRRLLARRAVEALFDALDTPAFDGEPLAADAKRAFRRARNALLLLLASVRGEGREELRRLLAGLAVVERSVTVARERPGAEH